MWGSVKVYLATIQDVELRSREYAVLAKDENDARLRLARGEFLTESESTVMDTIETKVTSIELAGEAEDHEIRTHGSSSAL